MSGASAWKKRQPRLATSGWKIVLRELSWFGDQDLPPLTTWLRTWLISESATWTAARNDNSIAISTRILGTGLGSRGATGASVASTLTSTRPPWRSAAHRASPPLRAGTSPAGLLTGRVREAGPMRFTERELTVALEGA